MNKKHVASIFVILAMVSVDAFAVVKASIDEGSRDSLPFKEGRLLVKTVPSTLDDPLASVANSIGAETVTTFSIVPGLRVYRFDESISIEDALAAFKSSEHVEYVEPDYYLNAAEQNDPRYPEQWSLDNTGQTNGVADADINAPTMWSIDDGDASVVVGVIDTGVDYRHLDLIENLWQNSLEIPGNSIDDDGNGFVDDIFGANAIRNSGDPFDDNSHGTHVSGTIGARGNNSIGVVGVAQQVKIAACKFLSGRGSGTTSDAILCMQYFANLKSRAIDPVNLVATNNSWGSAARSKALEDAIRSHERLGILFMAAAGNSSGNSDLSPYFPANYDLSNIITVAATDHADRLATFSNYGKRSVHLAAPGVKILSTTPNQSYGLLSGTSMATPHVTGLAAVIKAHFPDYNYKQIKALLISSGSPLAALQNNIISGRRIRGADVDGKGALSCVDQRVSSRMRPVDNIASILRGQGIYLSATRITCQEPSGTVSLYSNGGEEVILHDDGTNGDAVADDGVYSLLWQPQIAGHYPLNFGDGDTVTVTVSEPPPPPPPPPPAGI